MNAQVESQTTDVISRWALWLTVASVVLGLGACALGLARLAPGDWAFRILLAALVLLPGALLLALVGLWRCREGRREGRRRALVAAFVSLTLLVGAVASFAGVLRAPLINDITTDLDDPPQFAIEGALAGLAKGPPPFPTGSREIHARGYPDLRTLVMSAPLAEVRARARATAEEMGWEIGFVSADGGHIEATQTSRLFGFVDDIVVRVRAGTDGVAVDLRSRSRLGKGDLGANARRIERFLSRLQGPG